MLNISAADKVLVTPEEAAALLSVPIRRVYELAAAGELTRRYTGHGTRKYRILRADLDEWARGLPTEVP